MAEEIGDILRDLIKKVKSPCLVAIYDRAVILPRWQGRRPRTPGKLTFSSCSPENTSSLKVKDKHGEEEKKRAGESLKNLVMDESPSSQPYSLDRVEKKRHRQVKEHNKKNKKPRYTPVDEQMKQQEKKQKKEKKPRQIRQVIHLPPQPPPVFNPHDMPQEWKDFIEGELGGTEITRVCQKTLSNTDVDKHHRRLLLPEKIIKTLDFLRDDQREVVTLPSTKTVLRSVNAMVVGPSRTKHRLSFRKWHMKKGGGKVSVMYVLTEAAWNEFVDDNSLMVGDVVQLWSFRAAEDDIEDQLHMALIIVGRELYEA